MERMNFELPRGKQMVRDMVRDFVKRECPKEYMRELDEKGEFPDRLWDKMAELDLFSLPIPEAYGGEGGDTMDMTLIIEELAKASGAVAFIYLMSECYGGKSIEFCGNEEQKKEYLPKLARGEVKFALAMTESSGGADALTLGTQAVEEEDCFVINGAKNFVTGANVADYLITVARTSDDANEKSKGISLFIVDAKSPGIEMKKIKKLGIKAVTTHEVVFNNVRVPKNNLLGEKDKGWDNFTYTINNERILTAAVSVGLAQAALNDAIEHAKERKAFGKVIGQFQAIQHYIARSATEIELARLLTYKAACLQSEGKPCEVEATMAKLAAAEMAVAIANRGIQILGGYGYTMEYEMQRYWRDARLNRLGPISDEMCLNLIAESFGLPRSY